MKAVVSYFSFFDNTIISELVDVEDTKDEVSWKVALKKHSTFEKYSFSDLKFLGDDYTLARQCAFDAEFDFTVIFID